MLFRQLLDPETSTWTYLLGDEARGEAILIDPVLEQLDRDRTLLRELSLRLVATLETHVHADHVTGGGRLREALGSRVVVGAATGVENADVHLADGEVFRFGGLEIEARATPGHTDGCTSYVCHAHGIAFTGDALLIRGCGRTDFQQGDARRLFASVRTKIFSLPDDTLLYPGHDYRGRTVTTVAEEKAWNPRLGLERSESQFVEIMAGLDLAYPKRIDVAVPANLVSGLVEKPPVETTAVAAAMAEIGRQDAEAWQGMGI